MSELNLRRLTGGFAIASGVLILLVLGLYLPAGVAPRAEDAAKWTGYVSMHNSLLLTIILLTALSDACFLVFLAGLRHLIQQVKPEYEWAAGLVFAAGLVYTVIYLVGFVVIGGAVLDTVNSKADPTVVSALGEASVPALGAVGQITATLFLASAGYAIIGTRLLPGWTGYVAYVAALLNLVAVPAIYAGSGPTSLYTADGYIGIIGVVAYVIWLLGAGISLLVTSPQPALPRQTQRSPAL